MLELLRRPNPATDGGGLSRRCAGICFCRATLIWSGDRLDGEIRALHALRPDRVRIVEGSDGWPEAYEYRAGGSVRRIAAEGKGDAPATLLHVRLFHPLADIGRLSAAGGGADGARSPQRGVALEQGAARQFGPAVRRAGLSSRPTAAIWRPSSSTG